MKSEDKDSFEVGFCVIQGLASFLIKTEKLKYKRVELRQKLSGRRRLLGYILFKYSVFLASSFRFCEGTVDANVTVVLAVIWHLALCLTSFFCAIFFDLLKSQRHVKVGL